MPTSHWRGICPAGECETHIPIAEKMYQHLCSAHPNVDWSIAPLSRIHPVNEPQEATLRSGNINGSVLPSSESGPSSVQAFTHQEAAFFTCAVEGCTSQFSTPYKLHMHETSIHRLSEATQKSQFYRLKCSIPGCKSSSWTEKKLRGHLRRCHDANASKSVNTPPQQYRCLDCSRDFVNPNALEAHLRNKVHAIRPTLLELPPNTCMDCNKTFATAMGLQAHCASRRHNPITPGLKCVRPGCTRKFNSPSAMLHHLESGGCSSGINVYSVNKAIMDNDPSGIITNEHAVQMLDDWCEEQQGLISNVKELKDVSVWSSDEGEDSGMDDDQFGGGVILTPTSSNSASGTSSPGGMMMTPADSPTPTMLKKELAFLSRKKYTCPLCPNHRQFLDQYRLETHLKSAAHAPAIFHCPISLIEGYESVLEGKKRSHFRIFTSLSGLAQHLESESCKGGKATFEKVLRFVEARLREMGLEGRLLSSSAGEQKA